jgi:hypothetical protein
MVDIITTMMMRGIIGMVLVIIMEYGLIMRITGIIIMGMEAAITMEAATGEAVMEVDTIISHTKGFLRKTLLCTH